MRQRQMLRFAAAGFALALALVLGVFAYTSSASTASFGIFSDRPRVVCDRVGISAPSVFQGGRFQLKLSRYWTEPVEVDISFPDGRLFTVPAARLLDGTIDQVINNPAASRANANIAGEVSAVLTVPGTWPYGCYFFTGRGLLSGKVAGAALVVVPGGAPGPNPGPAFAAVTRVGSNEARGVQGSRVDINGSGFRGGERIDIWITAPDGTVLNFPPGPAIFADNSGDFRAAFTFDGLNPVGVYQFTIQGASSGYRVITTFTLTSPPVTPTGWATFRVAFPPDQADPQRSAFEVQGALFYPGERVDIWLTLPDGSVRGLPSQFADGVGDFYAVLYLDERLPTGFYQATARGSLSGHLVITSFTLQRAIPQDTIFNPVPGPAVIDSSSNITGPSPDVLDPFNQGTIGDRLP
ncbi:MAG: hypothetical protein RMK84_12695 [Oscillochloridaceae bacterium]|nr:hypothetical protein [Chloroflexaceae bacterium]MDW8390977.1 hypothetical protein [Oscillochloridaceae bacterium]